jgi:hypothetical protein
MSFKVSPMAQADGGNPQRTIHPQTGTTSSDAAARARAIMRGETPGINVSSADPLLDARVEAARVEQKKIKMRTNHTPGQDNVERAIDLATQGTVDAAAEAVNGEAPASEPPQTAALGTETPTGTDNEEKAPPAAEETKPLSPQFAALARQRRALQVKERDLQARERALESAPPKGAEELKARLKSEPLSVLQEAGVTYDQLTEALLNNQNGINPEVIKLREELKALKEGVDKTLTDRDAQAEAAALADMQRTAERLIETGDEYEMVRETRSIPKVMELIKRTWKQDGEVLDPSEALRLVEEDLISETLKTAAIKKVKAKLAPPAPAVTPPAPKPQTQQQPVMRTLTNRDTSIAPLSRKERAMKAFWAK